ncbi:Fic family protein [Syntrophomonas palmitatica]|uniref:Fic family protein n=1 Tax=Syntrophomonas palmitatica TaxID=402877 RepID=UPI0006D282F9|nr:Fic family protein [Syntrophomonas palmitatica]
MNTRCILEIDTIKKALDAYRPLPESINKIVKEYMDAEMTYHSLVLEGNSISLEETRMVLAGQNIPGKTAKEHYEILDHKEAIDYVEAYVQSKMPLSEMFIRDVHKLVMKRTCAQEAGKYRDVEIEIVGSSYTPPEHIDVPELVHGVVEEYNARIHELHPIERAAWLHFQIALIHPFADGNGRTARLLMNYSFLKDSYVPAIINRFVKEAYLDCLEEASVFMDMTAFIDFIAEAERDSIRHYLLLVKESDALE